MDFFDFSVLEIKLSKNIAIGKFNLMITMLSSQFNQGVISYYHTFRAFSSLLFKLDLKFKIVILLQFCNEVRFRSKAGVW